MSDGVDFLQADKHESLLQIDSMILMRIVKHSQSFQILSLQCLCNISKKKLKTKLIFCMQINIKASLKFISRLWVSKFSTRLILLLLLLLMVMIKHSQISQSNKFAIFLHYLKKEVRNGGHFSHGDKRQTFYKLVLSFFMEMARHVQNTQSRKWVIFLQYLFYCDAKHSYILWGSSHVCCYWSIFGLEFNIPLSTIKKPKLGLINYICPSLL